jgi:hypothetical protein
MTLREHIGTILAQKEAMKSPKQHSEILSFLFGISDFLLKPLAPGFCYLFIIDIP